MVIFLLWLQYSTSKIKKINTEMWNFLVLLFWYLFVCSSFLWLKSGSAQTLQWIEIRVFNLLYADEKFVIKKVCIERQIIGYWLMSLVCNFFVCLYLGLIFSVSFLIKGLTWIKMQLALLKLLDVSDAVIKWQTLVVDVMEGFLNIWSN